MLARLMLIVTFHIVASYASSGSGAVLLQMEVRGSEGALLPGVPITFHVPESIECVVPATGLITLRTFSSSGYGGNDCHTGNIAYTVLTVDVIVAKKVLHRQWVRSAPPVLQLVLDAEDEARLSRQVAFGFLRRSTLGGVWRTWALRVHFSLTAMVIVVAGKGFRK